MKRFRETSMRHEQEAYNAQQNERMFLTAEQTIEMLPDGDAVHVFVMSGLGALIGAPWQRKDVLEFIRNHQMELAGPVAPAQNHGLPCGSDRMFIETRILAPPAESEGGADD